MNSKLIGATAILLMMVACKDDPTPTQPPSTPTATATQGHTGETATPTATAPDGETPTDPHGDTPTEGQTSSPTPTQGGTPVTTPTEPAHVTPEGTPTEPPTPTVEPTPTGTPLPADPMTALELYPRAVNITQGDSIPLRWEGRLASGLVKDVEIDSWSIGDEAVAAVDAAGMLTGLAEGTTTVSAQGNGFTSNAISVSIVAGGEMRVQVVDAYSGSGLEGAEVFDHDTSVGVTDADGWITVDIDGRQLQTVTAKVDGYYLASILGTQSRQIRLPLRPVKSPVSFSGLADFSAIDDRLRTTEIRLGIITRSVQENPLALDFNTLIGPNRLVDLCGVEVYLPANFVGQAQACGIDILEYEVPAEPGTYAAYGLAGDLNLQDMQALLNNPDFYTNLGAFLSDLGPTLQNFAWSVVDDINMDSGEDVTDLPMDFAGRIDQSVIIRVPDLPDGATAEFPPMQFIAADMGDQGFLPIGIAGGTDLVQVYHPPLTGVLAGKTIQGMAMAAQNGVGSEGPYSMTMAAKKTDDPLEILELPPFLPLLFTAQMDISGREFEFFPLEGATLYRSVIVFTRENPRVEWDLYQLYDAPTVPRLPTPTPTPGEGTPTATPTPTATAAPSPYWALRIPNIPGTPQFRNFHWDISAYDTDRGTFESFVVGDSGGDLVEAAKFNNRLSRNIQYNLNK